MQLTRKHAHVVRKAVHGWKTNGLLATEVAERLDADIEAMSFDWRKLAKYAFRLAILGVVISIGSFLADERLLVWLASFFNLPPQLKCAFFAVSATALFVLGYQMHLLAPKRVYQNEAIYTLAALATAATIYEAGSIFKVEGAGFKDLLLTGCLIYAAVGLGIKSSQVWFFSLISLAGWIGSKSGYESGYGAYYFSMRDPVQFLFFSVTLVAAALGVGSYINDEGRKFNDKVSPYIPLQRVTLACGLFYGFMALWMMSIFGSAEMGMRWRDPQSGDLLFWSVIFALASFAAIYHGLRFGDRMSKGFGVTFLGINLYTRFYEIFWDSMHKGIFFMLLAASMWALGIYAESLYSVKKGGRQG